MLENVLTQEQSQQLLETAIGAAKAAAIPIKRYFNNQEFHTQFKNDGSPVTQADQEAEAIIRSHLLSHSEIGPLDILGEEQGLQGQGTTLRWTVDPIDGTRSFIHGIPLFGTIIALVDASQSHPILGVIHLPMLSLTYAAVRGGGCTCQGQTLSLSSQNNLENAIVAVGDPAQFASANRQGELQHLQKLCPYLRGYTDCFGHGLFSSGAVGVMLDPALNPWDVLATQVLIEEAGGKILQRPSSASGKVDALFGNPALVQRLADELSF